MVLQIQFFFKKNFPTQWKIGLVGSGDWAVPSVTHALSETWKPAAHCRTAQLGLLTSGAVSWEPTNVQKSWEPTTTQPAASQQPTERPRDATVRVVFLGLFACAVATSACLA